MSEDTRKTLKTEYLPITGRCREILIWWLYYNNVDNNTWCALFKTKKYQRRKAAAKRICDHWHWIVKKTFDLPKHYEYSIDTLGTSRFTPSYPKDKYAKYPNFVLVLKTKEGAYQP